MVNKDNIIIGNMTFRTLPNTSTDIICMYNSTGMQLLGQVENYLSKCRLHSLLDLRLILSTTWSGNCKGLSAPRMVQFTHFGVVCSPLPIVLATLKVILGGYNSFLTTILICLAVVKPLFS